LKTVKKKIDQASNVIGLDNESWSQHIYSPYARQCALLPSFSFHGSSISVQHHSTFDSQKQSDIPIVPTLL